MWGTEAQTTLRNQLASDCVLFINEAYTLNSGSELKAIEVIMRYLDYIEDKPLFTFAGYRKKVVNFQKVSDG